MDINTIHTPHLRPTNIPIFSWRGVFAPQISIPMAVLVLLALFAPSDVLSRYPLAKAITTAVTNYLPLISRHADSTAFSEVALLVNCLLWVFWLWCSLMYAVLGIVNRDIAKVRLRIIGRFSLKQHFLMLFFALPLLVVGLCVFTMMPGDPHFASGLTTKSRVGFAFMSWLMLWLSSMALGFQYLNIRMFIDTYVTKGEQDE